MFKHFLLFVVIIVFYFSAHSQNSKIDTISKIEPVIDSAILVDGVKEYLDSIQMNLAGFINDSSIIESVKDTTSLLVPDKDTLLSDSLVVVREKVDSLTKQDRAHEFKLKSYEQYTDYLEDSLLFDEADTLHYVIYSLNHLLQNDSVNINDTTKQAIQKLMRYSANREVDEVVTYLESNFKADSLKMYSDFRVKIFRDSLFNAVEYLIDAIPEDSLKIAFRNLNRDSVAFEVAESEHDSIHLKLYDNRGEYAVLWIIKKQAGVFDIQLEDGTYIEQAKQQKVVDPTVDADFRFPDLRKVKKTDITIGIWELDGLADIKFSQGYVSESWAEGGEGSISTLSILKYSADYSYGKIRNLDTDLEYRLGYIKAGDNDLKKNYDNFEINAKYGRHAFKDWYYSGLLNFKTQFFKGKEYLNDSTVNVVSEFLSPAYLVFSLGLDYKPSNKLTVLVSPLTSKFTIVADTASYEQSRYGVGKNEIIRKEIGAYVKAISKLKIKNNISLENKINFFTNYTNNPQNIDVDWELNLKVQLTDYIEMSLNTHLIYDDDVTFIDEDGNERGARVQFKEMFGIGFTYTF